MASMNISHSQLATLLDNTLLSSTLTQLAGKGNSAVLNELMKQGLDSEDVKTLIETFAKNIFLKSGESADRENLGLLKDIIKNFHALKADAGPPRLAQLKAALHATLKQIISQMLATPVHGTDKSPHTAYQHNQLLKNTDLLHSLTTDVNEKEPRNKKEQELFGLAQNHPGKEGDTGKKKHKGSTEELAELLQILYAIKLGLSRTLSTMLRFQKENTPLTLVHAFPDFDDRIALLKAMLKECDTILTHARR